MIKYLFSDIDGTLYVQEDIAKDDIEACKAFVEAGGIFSMATGRADLEIVNFAKQEGFPEPRFRVSANGSMIVDGEKTIFEESFSEKAAEFIQKHLRSILPELSIVEVSTPDHVYFLMEPEDWVLNYKEDSYTINEKVLNDFTEERFNILKMYIEGNETLMAELVDAINEKHSEHIEIFNDITAMNIGPKNIDKGTAIQHIMDKYDIKPEEIATIGDAANDIGMFKITPNSFTFNRSADFVKREANYVVDSVAEAIEIIMNKNKEEGSMK